MKYYLLVCKNQPVQNYLFYRVEPDPDAPPLFFTSGPPMWSRAERRYPLDRYREIYCKTCGTMDICKALAIGLDPSVKIRAKTDFAGTEDGGICASKRVVRFIRKIKPWGVRIIPLPGDAEYSLLWPHPLVKADAALALVHVHEVCPKCKRVKSATGGVDPFAMRLPRQSPCLFAPDIWPVTAVGPQTWFKADEAMYQLMKAERFTGVEWWANSLVEQPAWLEKSRRSAGKYIPPALALKEVKRRGDRGSRVLRQGFANALVGALEEDPDPGVVEEIKKLLLNPRFSDLHKILKKAVKGT